MKYIKYTLDSGVRLVMCPMSEMKSISIGVWVGVGGRHESDEMSGISHFLEHMLFKGTKKRTAAEISRAIEGIGGNMNAFTTEESTCFYVKVMGEKVNQALDVLADMFKEPAFHETELERERGVIREELKMSLDVPSQHVFEILRELMWPHQSLGRNLVGTEETIRHMKREHLFQFKDQNYTADNIVISIAGKMKSSEVKHDVEKKFAFLKNRGKPVFIPADEKQHKPEIKIFRKKTEQTHFCIGVRAYRKNHPDRFAQRILNAILGENMSSRLFQQIREKMGLSYDISSNMERFQDTGSMLVAGAVDERNLVKAIQAVLGELVKLAQVKVSSDELAMAKEYCVGQAGLGMERTSNQMIYMGESELSSGRILPFPDMVRSMRRVIREDVKKVAEDLFREGKLNLAIVGPIREEEKLEKAFHIT